MVGGVSGLIGKDQSMSIELAVRGGQRPWQKCRLETDMGVVVTEMPTTAKGVDEMARGSCSTDRDKSQGPDLMQ